MAAGGYLRGNGYLREAPTKKGCNTHGCLTLKPHRQEKLGSSCGITIASDTFKLIVSVGLMLNRGLI